MKSYKKQKPKKKPKQRGGNIPISMLYPLILLISLGGIYIISKLLYSEPTVDHPLSSEENNEIVRKTFEEIASKQMIDNSITNNDGSFVVDGSFNKGFSDDRNNLTQRRADLDIPIVKEPDWSGDLSEINNPWYVAPKEPEEQEESDWSKDLSAKNNAWYVDPVYTAALKRRRRFR